MPRTRLLRRAALLTGVAALAAPLVATQATPTEVHDRLAPAASSGPTNAGKVYRWGDSQWHDGFTERLTRAWSAHPRRQVDNQHGMLTLNATRGGPSVSATFTGHGRQYGRWETRVRAEQYTGRHTPYRVLVELVPDGDRAYHCGARNIGLADYKLGTGRAHMHIRNLPNVQFSDSKALNLRPGVFHTYAVEVTKSHISWFVDAHVVMTERRSEARSGTTFAVRFMLKAVKGKRMNPGRMQMDWVRYYTLDRPNARSIDAPQATRGIYRNAC